MADLDRIQDKAANLSEFLSNQDLRAEYLAAAQAYFGGEYDFPNASFEAILEMLEKMANSDPLIGERAWRKGPVGPTFAIQISHPQTRQLDEPAWTDFFNLARNQIKAKSGRWQNWWASEGVIAQFVQEVARAEAQFRDRLKIGYSNEALKALIDEHEAVISALLLYQIELLDNEEALRSTNWEVVSSATNKLATQKNLIWQPHFEAAPILTKYWKHLAPDLLSTAQKSDRFTKISNQEKDREIVFRGVTLPLSWTLFPIDSSRPQIGPGS